MIELLYCTILLFKYNGKHNGVLLVFVFSCRGLYFHLKTIFIPPFPKMIFFSPRKTLFFNSYRALFALILPYFFFFHLFYLLTSHFLSFSFSLLPVFPFYSFSLTLPPFSLPLSIFPPPQMPSADIFSPPRGGGYFPIYRPLFSCQIYRGPKRN